jgi:hypothetical protein
MCVDFFEDEKEECLSVLIFLWPKDVDFPLHYNL